MRQNPNKPDPADQPGLFRLLVSAVEKLRIIGPSVANISTSSANLETKLDNVVSELQDLDTSIVTGLANVVGAIEGIECGGDSSGNCISVLNFVAGPITGFTDTGTEGDAYWSAPYLWICIATDTWIRFAVESQ